MTLEVYWERIQIPLVQFMNLPKLYSKLHKINKVLLESVQNAAQQSMNAAVNDEENGEYGPGHF